MVEPRSRNTITAIELGGAAKTSASNEVTADEVEGIKPKHRETIVSRSFGNLEVVARYFARISDDQFWKVISALSIIHGIILLGLLIHNGGAYTMISISLTITSGGFWFCFMLLSWCLSPRVDHYDQAPLEITGEMLTVISWIQEGAQAFYKVQYGAISVLTVITAIALGIGFYFKSADSFPKGLEDLYGLPIAAITTFSFLVGALCSALSGYIGLWTSVRVNGEVANSARFHYGRAMECCFKGGAICAIANISLAVLGISIATGVIRYTLPSLGPEQSAMLLSGYSFGASLVAMFAQLGGGIYTKAADIGADLVGKVENSIPEDDPRNPAVIADLVGDNVGDCAGQCADLFESISAEIISAMIIGGSLAGHMNLDTQSSWRLCLFPLLVHSLDIVASSVGCLWVKIRDPKINANNQDPLSLMVQGYAFACLTAMIGLLLICRHCLIFGEDNTSWMYYYLATLVGMAVAVGFVLVTQYYTDYNYGKVQSIADASVSGPATNIISGLSVGMESTGPSVIMISGAILIAFYLGKATELTPNKRLDGLFGCAAATMGMLSTSGYTLTMSSFGPIADNAGGIVELTNQPEEVRVVTDRLDAVGNVTKANTKGFSIGSAALACFLLFAAFVDEVELYSKISISHVDLTSPDVFVGGLLGGMTVFVFAGQAMKAVSGAAQECVMEVRRQFSEDPRILKGEVTADYQSCVAISSRAALKQMILPGTIATLSPIMTGLIFRCIGEWKADPLLGVNALIGFQIFATVVGILMALFLNNAGGAWDNAKKYIETGPLGGKNSDAHKASVVGDTVGDPCKDTAGPSVHVLIKLVCTVSIVLTPIFIGYLNNNSETAAKAAKAIIDTAENTII